MRWDANHIKPRNCIQCEKPLTTPQLYRKNKYCGNKCMGIRHTLPDRIGRMRIHGLKYRTKNKERLAQRRKELMAERRDKVYELLGDRCAKCSFSDKRALQIDHVNGHGLRERSNPRISDSKYYYLVVCKSVLNNENKYQMLCANCNWIKRYENKESGWDYKLKRNEFHTAKQEIAVAL